MPEPTGLLDSDVWQKVRFLSIEVIEDHHKHKNQKIKIFIKPFHDPPNSTNYHVIFNTANKMRDARHMAHCE